MRSLLFLWRVGALVDFGVALVFKVTCWYPTPAVYLISGALVESLLFIFNMFSAQFFFVRRATRHSAVYCSPSVNNIFTVCIFYSNCCFDNNSLRTYQTWVADARIFNLWVPFDIFLDLLPPSLIFFYFIFFSRQNCLRDSHCLVKMRCCIF